MEERAYLHGQKHGRQLLFWENGKKKVEFMARADVYEGEVREWNAAGRLVHYVNGQEEGPRAQAAEQQTEEGFHFQA
jgi:antitoxin component YwqK of YwqJK toxin-antitoxin module